MITSQKREDPGLRGVFPFLVDSFHHEQTKPFQKKRKKRGALLYP